MNTGKLYEIPDWEIVAALKRTGGNTTHAAKLLKVKRTSLIASMKARGTFQSTLDLIRVNSGHTNGRQIVVNVPEGRFTKAWQSAKGNVLETARRLQINPSVVYRLLNRYGLTRQDARP